MKGKLVIDGNAVYEIDGDCMQKLEERQQAKNRMESRHSPDRPNRRRWEAGNTETRY